MARKKRPTEAEQIKLLLKIYRAAVASHDDDLRRCTAHELAARGLNVDLIEQAKGATDAQGGAR